MAALQVLFFSRNDWQTRKPHRIVLLAVKQGIKNNWTSSLQGKKRRHSSFGVRHVWHMGLYKTLAHIRMSDIARVLGTSRLKWNTKNSKQRLDKKRRQKNRLSDKSYGNDAWRSPSTAIYCQNNEKPGNTKNADLWTSCGEEFWRNIPWRKEICRAKIYCTRSQQSSASVKQWKHFAMRTFEKKRSLHPLRPASGSEAESG